MLKIYEEYQKHGIDNYYKNFSEEYFNPHQEKIEKIYLKYIKDIIHTDNTVLDLASGDGLISKLIKKYNKNHNVIGCDPYFFNNFNELHLTFEEIAKGELNKFNKNYEITICSYAFHLLDKKWHYDFLTQLGMITNKFIIITPSKKIDINHFMWTVEKYIREDKVTIIILNKN